MSRRPIAALAFSCMLALACARAPADAQPASSAHGVSARSLRLSVDVGTPYRVDRVLVFFDGARVEELGATPAVPPPHPRPPIDLWPLRDGVHSVAVVAVVSLPCGLGVEPREAIALRLTQPIATRGAFDAHVVLRIRGTALDAFEARPELALELAGGADVAATTFDPRDLALRVPEECDELEGSARLVCGAKAELDVARRNADHVATDCTKRRLDDMLDALSRPDGDAEVKQAAARACYAYDPIAPGTSRHVLACPGPDL